MIKIFKTMPKVWKGLVISVVILVLINATNFYYLLDVYLGS